MVALTLSSFQHCCSSSYALPSSSFLCEMVAKFRSVLKNKQRHSHEAIMALTCPSTAALYPPRRHHHHRHHHHHHWWEPPSFISCVMEANLRWVFKKKCTTMLLVLTFFHSRTLLVLTFFFRSRPSLHPSPDWSSFRFATPLIVVITWKRKIGFYRCQILPALVFAKLRLPPAVIEMILDSTVYILRNHLRRSGGHWSVCVP